MKHLKMLGLAAIAAGALMAFVGAGTASATELICKNGSGVEEMCAAPTSISAEVQPGTKVVLDPPFGAIECSKSAVSGSASTGGATSTPNGSNSTLTFESCNATVTVLKKGSLEVHTQGATANDNGLLTSTGTEVTVEFIGTHCIFATSNTNIGTLTGSDTTKGKATLDISATIPRTGGRSGAFCGSTAAWTGAYTVTAPAFLDIDN